MQRREYIAGIGAGSIASLTGCLGMLDGGSSGTIKIGALEPLSGPFGSIWGDTHLHGMQMALDEINEGDTLDKEIEIVQTDTEVNPGKADSAFRRHVEQDDVVAVTGAVSSDVGIRLARTAEELEVPNFLNQAGSEEILSRDSRYTFRVGWLPAPTHVEADVQFIQEQDISKVGVIVADYAWGRSVEANMQEQIPSDVDLQIEVAPAGEDNFSSHLRNLPDDIELLSVLGHPPGAASATAQMFELGMEATVLGVDIPPKLVIEILGERVTNDIISRQLTDTSSQKFAELGQEVADRWNEPMYDFEVHGYVTARMIGEAVAEKGNDPAAVADYVRSTEFDYGVYNNPIKYTEWGELDQAVVQYSEFVAEAPSYFPDGQYRLNPIQQSSPLEAYDPSG